MAKRIEWIDFIKAMCLILMVVGHYDFTPPIIKKLIYSFHMPIFFMISGYLNNTKKPFFAYCKKKITSLLLPFIVWNFIWLSIGIFMNVPAGITWSDGLIDAFLWNNPQSQPLWFLYTLLLTDLAYFGIRNTKLQTKILLALFVYCIGNYLQYNNICLPLKIEIVFFSLFYYVIGNICALSIKIHISTFILYVSLCLLLVLSCFSYRFDLYSNHNVWYSHLLSALISVNIIILVRQNSNYCLMSRKECTHIALNAIVILACHSKLFWIINKTMYQVGIEHWIIVNLLTTALIVPFALWCICFISNKYAPVLNGRPMFNKQNHSSVGIW